MYELDRHVRTQVRKLTQQPVRRMRDQIERLTTKLDKDETVESAQLAVQADYALGIQTALNLDGQQPFQYASLAVDTALTEVAASLAALEKKGRP